MCGDIERLTDRLASLEQRLRKAEQRVSYYRELAEKAGVARLQETETLSQILVERNRIEAEFQQHRDNLEELIETRTIALSQSVAETQQLNAQLQQEIRERKRAEESIRESEEQFRILAQDSPDVIMRFDSSFRHLYVNPGVLAQTGIPHQEFIGKTHREIGFPPELIEPWEEAIQKVFDSKEAQRMEFKLPNDAWIDWLLYPEFGPSGEVNAVLTTARDITEYKKIEETLRREIIERQRSEEKQRQLETQLRQTQKLEALGRLAGGIAHDFNNILAIILGHVELLYQDAPDESREQASLGNVWRAGERASELIRQILLFSRFQEYRMEPTDLSQVIEETLILIRATIPTSIDIRSHIQPGCHSILADVSQIQQIIVNLCVNAKHAMQEEGGTLTVSLAECACFGDTARKHGLDPGLYLKLMIGDTGQGMPDQVQEHIFEPFFTTKTVGEGSGLGLAVVHGIVTAHGGKIIVESEVGRGTKFFVCFPVIDEATAPAAPLEDCVEMSRQQGHILVVDDEIDLANLYELALTKSGYQVTTCFNGNDALDTFRASPDQFDLVFTDQVMPGLTGVELGHEILKIREDVPIILATGYSDTVSEQNAAEFGLRESFLKPVKIRTLITAIQRILAY